MNMPTPRTVTEPLINLASMSSYIIINHHISSYAIMILSDFSFCIDHANTVIVTVL